MPQQSTTKVHKFKSGPDSFIGPELQCWSMLDSAASLDDLFGLALTLSKDASGKFQLQFTLMPRKWAAHLSWIILPLSITFWLQCTLVMFFVFRFDLLHKSSLLPVHNLVLADKRTVKAGSVLSLNCHLVQPYLNLQYFGLSVSTRGS